MLHTYDKHWLWPFWKTDIKRKGMFIQLHRILITIISNDILHIHNALYQMQNGFNFLPRTQTGRKEYAGPGCEWTAAGGQKSPWEFSCWSANAARQQRNSGPASQGPDHQGGPVTRTKEWAQPSLWEGVQRKPRDIARGCDLRNRGGTCSRARSPVLVWAATPSMSGDWIKRNSWGKTPSRSEATGTMECSLLRTGWGQKTASPAWSVLLGKLPNQHGFSHKPHLTRITQRPL